MGKLPTDQGGVGRHKCAACAYEAGYAAGYRLDGSLSIDKVLANLDESQARPKGTKVHMRHMHWATITEYVKEYKTTITDNYDKRWHWWFKHPNWTQIRSQS